MFNRFHAYAVVMEMESFEGTPLNSDASEANVILKKKTYGGVPPGAGMREDVIELFEELEEARNSLAQIQALMQELAKQEKNNSITYNHKGIIKEIIYYREQ